MSAGAVRPSGGGERTVVPSRNGHPKLAPGPVAVRVVADSGADVELAVRPELELAAVVLQADGTEVEQVAEASPADLVDAQPRVTVHVVGVEAAAAPGDREQPALVDGLVRGRHD